MNKILNILIGLTVFLTAVTANGQGQSKLIIKLDPVVSGCSFNGSSITINGNQTSLSTNDGTYTYYFDSGDSSPLNVSATMKYICYRTAPLESYVLEGSFSHTFEDRGSCEFVTSGWVDGGTHNYKIVFEYYPAPVSNIELKINGAAAVGNQFCESDEVKLETTATLGQYAWQVKKAGTTTWYDFEVGADNFANLSPNNFFVTEFSNAGYDMYNTGYEFRVTSNDACQFYSASPVIGPIKFYPSAPVPDMPLPTPPNCHGGEDASITINNISGGSEIYYVTVEPYYTNTSQCGGPYGDLLTKKFGTDSTEVQVCNPIYAYNFTYEPAVDGPLVITQGTPTKEIVKGTDEVRDSIATISMLPAGYYRITIENSINNDNQVGCYYEYDFLIEDYEEVTVVANITSSSSFSTDYHLECAESTNGSVDLSVSGGVGGYTLQSGLPPGASSDTTGSVVTVSGLSAGTHNLVVADSNGCSAPIAITMIPPPALQVNSSLTYGNCQAIYTLVPVDSTGSGSYSYSRDNINWQTDSTFSFPIEEQEHPVFYVQDVVRGCIWAGSPGDTIGVPPPLSIPSISEFQPPSCHDSADGKVRVEVSGGANDQYTFYLLEDAGGSSTPIDTVSTHSNVAILEGLRGDIPYLVQVFDAYDCSITTTTSISKPLPVSLVIDPPYYTYFGNDRANIPVTASGGTLSAGGSYGYLLLRGGETLDMISGSGEGVFFENKAEGNYEVKALDENDCEVTETVTVTPHPYITNVDSISATCNGDFNGAISFKVNWTDTIQYNIYLKNTSEGEAHFRQLAADEYQKHSDSVTYTITGLNAGEYAFKVAERAHPANSYSFPHTVTVTQPPLISASFFPPVPPSCQGDSTGSVLAINEVSGGNSPSNISYTWYRGSCGQELFAGDTLSTNDTLSNVTAGFYAVIIQDSLGCTKCIDEKEVPETPALTFSAVPILQSCEAVVDGWFDLNQTIERPFYRLYLNGNMHPIDSLDQAPWAFDSLQAGEYVIELEDLDKGCLAYDTLSIGVRTLTLTIDSTRNVSCFGGADGYLLAQMSGGVTEPTYRLRNLLTEEDTVFSGEAYWLAAGRYQVIATANEGCFIESDTIEISQPEELLVAATEDRPGYCGNANGAASAAISGGTAPFTVRWSPVGGGPVPDTTALTAGRYVVRVTDAMQCQATDTVSVRNLTSNIQLTSSTTDYICEEEGGSLTMTLHGEAAPFRLALLRAGSTDTLRLFEAVAAGASFTANSLEDGIYTLKVSDSNGCTFTTTDTIAYSPIAVSMAATEESTCGQANGSYTIAISGGAESYRWSWSPNVPAAEGLQALDLHADSLYFVDVSDASGCLSRHNFQIGNTNGPSIRLVAADSTSYCGQAVGAATVEGSGGNGALTYLWTLEDGTAYASGTAVTSIDTLRANTYRIRVQDETGCFSRSLSFTVSDEPDPVLSLNLLDSTACSQPLGRAEARMSGGEGPYTYRWWYADGEDAGQVVAESAIAEGLFARRYRVEGTDSRGCTNSASIYIPEKANPQIWEIEVEDASCGLATGWAEVGSRGGTGTHSYVWADAEGNELPDTTARAVDLPLGSYTVYAVDANGCQSPVIPIEIVEKSSLSIYQAANQPASCAEGADGLLEVVVEGGTAPYTYQWNDPAAQTTARAEGLAAGTYTVVVTDASGCSLSRSLDVSAPAAIRILNWAEQIPACTGEENGSLNVRVEGGTAPYSYAWATAQGAVLEGQTTATARGLGAGTYTVTVSDARGCTFSESYELADREPLTTTGIPSGAVICNGQTYVLDAGSGWQSYRWSSELGFSSTSQRVELTNAGLYYLEAVNHRGCVVQDTFLLEVSNDALTADFLMASRGYVGDTLVLIDISWPLPTAVRWHYQQEEGFEIITNDDFVQELLFTEPGTYTVELEAFLAECRSSVSKQIIIEEAGTAPPDEGGRMNSSNIIYATKVYPNPNRGRFKVEVELTETAPLRMEVLSIYTAEVLHVVSFEDKRKVEVPLDISGLKDGLYLLRVVAGDSYKNIRFYIQH